MSMFHRFPYTDFNDINLDWIINQLKEINEEWKEYQLLNILNFPNPNEWNSKQAYPKLSVVMGPDGNSYLSTTAVPPGVIYSDTRYWIKIIDIGLKDKNQDKAIETNAGKIKANSDLINKVKTEIDKEISRTNSKVNENKNLIDNNKSSIKVIEKEIESLQGNITNMFTKTFIRPIGNPAVNLGQTTLVYNDDVTILLDAGDESQASCIIEELNKIGKPYVDYFILSHWHQDHIAGIKKLVSEHIINSKTTAILPHGGINWGRLVGFAKNYEKVYRDHVTLFNRYNVNIKYPHEDEELKLCNNLYAKFNNLSESYYNDYYNVLGSGDSYNNPPANSTDYNNFSMVTSLYINNKCIIFPGDLSFEGQKHVYNHLSYCDIYFVEHHALNFSTYDKYIAKLKPKISVISSLYNPQKRLITDMLNYSVSQVIMTGPVYTTIHNPKMRIIIDKGIYLQDGVEPIAYEPNTFGANMLPLNYDLNNLTVSGNYFVPNGSYCETIKNLPKSCNNAGYLIKVEKETLNKGAVRQSMRMLYPNPNPLKDSFNVYSGYRTFFRNMDDDGNWTTWMATNATWAEGFFGPTPEVRPCMVGNGRVMVFTYGAIMDLRISVTFNWSGTGYQKLCDVGALLNTNRYATFGGLKDYVKFKVGTDGYLYALKSDSSPANIERDYTFTFTQRQFT